MLEELRGLGLNEALRIMRMEIEPTHPQFARILEIKRSIIQSVITATVRVDSDALRGAKDDRYDEMLQAALKLKAELSAGS